MQPSELKRQLETLVLPRVQSPGQYVGGEWNSVVKNHARVRGKVCLAFPDLYSIGMSHHGLQVLYAAMNCRDDWACERVFAPMHDMEQILREKNLPLFGLESFTPLNQYDVVGFTLQYDLCYSNVLTILDLGRIPLQASERGEDCPLILAGGPCVSNPEPMARFIDAFALGDGEASLPAICELWKSLRESGRSRADSLAELAAQLPFVYVPRFYEPACDPTGRPTAPRKTLDSAPDVIVPAVVEDLDSVPLPTSPIVPNVECVQDRIALEIMRGCPGKCRFCQSTTLKRPLRFRSVETLVRAAEESYRNTGYNEISLLSLSSSDYPHFGELMRRLSEIFRPRGVAISLPSLRVNEQLQLVGELLNTDRHSGLTLAPEAACDDMRRRIGKPITNEDLLAGCRIAFENGFDRVKLYFMCGLPGETEDDLYGILDLSEQVALLGKKVSGKFPSVTANVSNFVPKPQTPFQWSGMQSEEYFRNAHQLLRFSKRMRCVAVKCHGVETSLLEGVLCRGDRQVGVAIERAWRDGARLDGWTEYFDVGLWKAAFDAVGLDVHSLLHQDYAAEAALPWDRVSIRQGRAYLEREHAASCMAE